ncbi:glycosyltransferase [Roseovarius indicus]|uniref:glycosyltransferase n=1 Tax=Roseovarius indicus TaxID=540747 RepID=UPI0032EC750E
MRIIGVCRFSYPGVGGGFKRDHETAADRAALLYAPDRMEDRFRHFEALTLPSLAAQHDDDFTFLIVIGTSLPALWRDRLHDLTAPVPQVKVVAKEDDAYHQIRALRSAVHQEVAANPVETVQFRLDDDDAVALGFTARLRQAWTDTAPLRAAHPSLAVDFNMGRIARLSAQGIATRQVVPPFWSCGMAGMFRAGATDALIQYPHHRIHTFMPTLVYPGEEMFLRGVHDDNDSTSDKAPDNRPLFQNLQPLDDDGRRHFRDTFNVDEALVRRIFSAPAGTPGTA